MANGNIDPLGRAIGGQGQGGFVPNPTSDPAEIQRRKGIIKPMLDEFGNFLRTPQGAMAGLLMAQELQRPRDPTSENTGFGARVTDAALQGAEFTSNYQANLQAQQAATQEQQREDLRLQETQRANRAAENLTAEEIAARQETTQAQIESREGIATADRASQASIAEADRTSRENIAAAGEETERQRIQASAAMEARRYGLQESGEVVDMFANAVEAYNNLLVPEDQKPPYSRFVREQFNTQVRAMPPDSQIQEIPTPTPSETQVKEAIDFIREGQAQGLNPQRLIESYANQVDVDTETLRQRVMQALQETPAGQPEGQSATQDQAVPEEQGIQTVGDLVLALPNLTPQSIFFQLGQELVKKSATEIKKIWNTPLSEFTSNEE